MSNLVIDTVTYSSPNFTERRGAATPNILVIHYTACPEDEAAYILTSKTKGVSAHYLVPSRGNTVYQLVDESQRAHHAGESYWRGIDDVNSSSIGIENVNWGYTYGWMPPEPMHPLLRWAWSSIIHIERRIGEYLETRQYLPSILLQKQWHPFPEEQIQTFIELAKQILKRYNIEDESVIGHADVSPQRKVDPGPLFPWKQLADREIGIWPDLTTDRIHSTKPRETSISWMQQSLAEWGYKVPHNGMLDPATEKVVRAFQMHFRPSCCDGRIDAESCDLLDALLCQRKNRHDQ